MVFISKSPRDGRLCFSDIVWLMCVLHDFQQYFSYIVANSFIGGGNQ